MSVLKRCGEKIRGHLRFSACGLRECVAEICAAKAPAGTSAEGSKEIPAEAGSLPRLRRRGFKYLGEDVSEMLEYVPARFKVIRQVRPTLACACCERIVQAEAPSRPIERGIAGPGLLAHVLVSKYCDHLPLYRQSEIYAREGVELERARPWRTGCRRNESALLAPLVEALRRHVMSATKLHADDTPVPVLAPGNGKTKPGRLWTYVRDDRPAGKRNTCGGVVRLHAGSQRRASASRT